MCQRSDLFPLSLRYLTIRPSIRGSGPLKFFTLDQCSLRPIKLTFLDHFGKIRNSISIGTFCCRWNKATVDRRLPPFHSPQCLLADAYCWAKFGWNRCHIFCCYAPATWIWTWCMIEPVCENMTSSTKHNISQRHQRRTEPQPCVWDMGMDGQTYSSQYFVTIQSLR